MNYASRLPWIEKLFDAPIRDASGDSAAQEGIISFQHPDHETAHWPQQGMKL